MTNTTFSVFSGIFGFAVAAISLFALIIEIFRSHLPSNKIKKLDSLLDETETFFKKTIEEGLLTESDFVRETERHLIILRTRTYVLRSSAYNATTLYKDYTELLGGTSSAIERTCDSLRKLKAQVVKSSQEGRGMAQTSSAPEATSVPATSPPNPDPERHATALPSTDIPRPHSPSIPSGTNLDDGQHASAESNPLHNSMQGGLDVRTADAQSCASTVHTSVTL